MIKFEVAEELIKNHLVVFTENAGPFLLAYVNDKFIYVYIDNVVAFFDNADQADAAKRDVDIYVRFWKERGKKLYFDKEV